MKATSPLSLLNTDRRIRLGVWGLGRGSHIIHTASSTNIDIVAGCDFDENLIQKFKAGNPNGKFTKDAKEFLSWDFDAVLLATFCPSHATDAIQALRAGKHVLSEVTAFHTPAEGVALVEEVERSGLIYQMAENYPYTLENRYLASLWKKGLFGELQYAEYSYLHDCLDLAYSYNSGPAIEPGSSVHQWRSWFPWHYYSTHSLGPVMSITGTRPVSVVSLPSELKIPGHLMAPPYGLSGTASSLIQMSNGGLMRNLMAGCTHDRDVKVINGTRGSSELIDGQLRLRLGGRGHSPCRPVSPPQDPLSKLAMESGHGGADFWILYHFANEILNGIKSNCDVYQASDMTLAGIQAFRSSLENGKRFEIPDFRNAEVRARYRNDHFAPTRYEVETGPFGKDSKNPIALKFTSVMKTLLHHVDEAQAFFDWSKITEALGATEELHQQGASLLQKHGEITKVIQAAQEIIHAFPQSDGARVLLETLQRIPLEYFQDENDSSKLSAYSLQFQPTTKEAP